MKLASDAHQWKKLWSMRWIIVTTFLASIPVAYMTLPDDWLPALPDWLKAGFAYATLLTAGLSGVARLLKQPWPPLEKRE